METSALRFQEYQNGKGRGREHVEDKSNAQIVGVLIHAEGFEALV